MADAIKLIYQGRKVGEAFVVDTYKGGNALRIADTSGCVVGSFENGVFRDNSGHEHVGIQRYLSDLKN